MNFDLMPPRRAFDVLMKSIESRFETLLKDEGWEPVAMFEALLVAALEMADLAGCRDEVDRPDPEKVERLMQIVKAVVERRKK